MLTRHVWTSLAFVAMTGCVASHRTSGANAEKANPPKSIMAQSEDKAATAEAEGEPMSARLETTGTKKKVRHPAARALGNAPQQPGQPEGAMAVQPMRKRPDENHPMDSMLGSTGEADGASSKLVIHVISVKNIAPDKAPTYRRLITRQLSSSACVRRAASGQSTIRVSIVVRSNGAISVSGGTPTLRRCIRHVFLSIARILKRNGDATDRNTRVRFVVTIETP